MKREFLVHDRVSWIHGKKRLVGKVEACDSISRICTVRTFYDAWMVLNTATCVLVSRKQVRKGP